jgi:hypothetical protein
VNERVGGFKDVSAPIAICVLIDVNSLEQLWLICSWFATSLSHPPVVERTNEWTCSMLPSVCDDNGHSTILCQWHLFSHFLTCESIHICLIMAKCCHCTVLIIFDKLLHLFLPLHPTKIKLVQAVVLWCTG